MKKEKQTVVLPPQGRDVSSVSSKQQIDHWLHLKHNNKFTTLKLSREEESWQEVEELFLHSSSSQMFTK